MIIDEGAARADLFTIFIDPEVLLEDREMASEGYHEAIAELSDESRGRQRAIVSLSEEIDAVDGCKPRPAVCQDSAHGLYPRGIDLWNRAST